MDIEIKISNKKHIFGIFRKPTTSDIVIHNNSCRSIAHKLADFHSMIRRLTSIPLDKTSFKKELGIIKQIACQNGYKSTFIDRILETKIEMSTLNLIYSQLSEPELKPKLIIPYYGQISETIKQKF